MRDIEKPQLVVVGTIRRTGMVCGTWGASLIIPSAASISVADTMVTSQPLLSADSTSLCALPVRATISMITVTTTNVYILRIISVIV